MSYQGSSSPQGGSRVASAAPRSLATPGGGAIGFRDLVGMLRRHLLLLMVLLILISGAGVSYTLYLYYYQPTYMAEAMIEVDPGDRGDQNVREMDQRISVQLLPQYINNQVQVIKDERNMAMSLDPDTAEKIVEKLDKADRGSRTDDNDDRIRERARRISAAAADFFGTSDTRVQASLLSDRISVTHPLRTQLIRVRLYGRDPRLITDLVNAAVDSYMLNYQQSRKSRESRRLDGLQAKVNFVGIKLTTKRNEIRQLRQNNPSVTLRRGLTDTQRRAELLQTSRTQAWLEMIQNQQDVEEPGEGTPIEDQPVSEEIKLIIEGDSVLNTHKAVLSNLLRERAQRAMVLHESHDEMKAFDSRIATTEKLIEDRTKSLTKTLIAQRKEEADIRYKAAQARFAMIDAEYKTASTQARQQDQDSLEYEQRLSELAELEEERSRIGRAMSATEIGMAVSANNVFVRQAAQEPTPGDKAGPVLLFYLPASIFLGLVISVAMVLVVELVDNRVRTPTEVLRYVQLPVLGCLPDRREDRQVPEGVELPLLVRDVPQSLIAESFRQLRTALMYSTDTDLRTLLITSARAGAGKTVVASNLAITLAQGGSRVLMIDTNFRQPMIHRVYDLPNSVGLSSVLARLNSLDEAVQTTSVANLDVLPCGPVPPSPADLLGSEAMQSLLADVRGKYDAVILDGAPALVVADAHVLCSMVDGTAMVISAADTPRGVASRARRTLQDLKARVVGAVLNKVRATKGGYFRETYNSYYAYSSGGEPRPVAAREAAPEESE